MAISQIQPNLFLGNQYSTTFAEVESVVSIGCNSKCPSSAVHRFKYAMKDSKESDLSQIYEDATQLIHQQLLEGRRVLVHCKAGMNRSPMVVVAYLCKYDELSVEEAIREVKTKRPIVRIQLHYLEQLVSWLQSEVHLN